MIVFFGAIVGLWFAIGSIDAAQTTVLLSLALTGVAFAVGFLLPRRARQSV